MSDQNSFDLIKDELQNDDQMSILTVTPFATTEETYEDPKSYLEAPFSYHMSNNESVSLNNGSLQHTVTDFVLPGHNGFDLNITRKYDSYCSNTTDMTPAYTSAYFKHYVIRCDQLSFKQPSISSQVVVKNLVLDYSTASKAQFAAELDAEKKSRIGNLNMIPVMKSKLISMC